MSLLTDEVRAWIGREATFTAPEELGRAAIRYFAIAVGDDNPLYRDDDYARRHGYPSVIAPPTLVCETNQYMSGRPDRDGYLGHRWDLPLPDCQMLRGGHQYEFHRPVLPTDVVTATWRLADIFEKGELLFVVSEVTYANQDGDVLASNRDTIIYRPT